MASNSNMNVLFKAETLTINPCPAVWLPRDFCQTCISIRVLADLKETKTSHRDVATILYACKIQINVVFRPNLSQSCSIFLRWQKPIHDRLITLVRPLNGLHKGDPNMRGWQVRSVRLGAFCIICSLLKFGSRPARMKHHGSEYMTCSIYGQVDHTKIPRCQAQNWFGNNSSIWTRYIVLRNLRRKLSEK